MKKWILETLLKIFIKLEDDASNGSCANCLSTSAYFTHNWYHKVVLGQEKKMYKGPIK